ncbi:hypothetical protein DPX16_0065 [Anabarilius grahami]|uniref:Immunoglobulin subtype domain-containing protein n=1 Tax=Anabarilius grahami TaxID=495550 RepID=A0A3N0Z423_ANAGA|nr:hypothetical protein DPX16_0065 [Anabarilius grahami]
MWWFGGSIIAETDGNEASYTKDERFRDRLKLNNQTGSLTIKNMRITVSGVYHLEINHNTVISNKTFSVTVQEFEVKRESVMEGDSVISQSCCCSVYIHNCDWATGDHMTDIQNNPF